MAALKDQITAAQLEALQQVADIPRLPPYAPKSLAAYTIEVEDPTKIYSVHKGLRKHNLSILLDKFIHQIRYGCGSDDCKAPTCLSYMRRMAGSKPFRRYNATSTRIMAVHLASRDNPEEALCQQFNRLARSSPQESLSLQGLHKSAPGSKPAHPRPSIRNSNRSNVDGNAGTIIRGVVRKPHQAVGVGIDHKILDAASPTMEDETSKSTHIRSQQPEEPVKIDSKSFVQNLFDTDSFRLLEWLTPSSLYKVVQSSSDKDDEMSKSQETKANQDINQTKHELTVSFEAPSSVTIANDPKDDLDEESSSVNGSSGSSDTNLTDEMIAAEARAVNIEDAVPIISSPERRKNSVGNLDDGNHDKVAKRGSIKSHSPSIRRDSFSWNDHNQIGCRPNAPSPERSRHPSSKSRIENVDTSTVLVSNQSEAYDSQITHQVAHEEVLVADQPSTEWQLSGTRKIGKHSMKIEAEDEVLLPQKSRNRMHSQAQSLRVFNKEALGMLSTMMPFVYVPDPRDHFTSLHAPETTSFNSNLSKSRKEGLHHRPFFGPYNNPTITFRSALNSSMTPQIQEARDRMVDEVAKQIMDEDAASDEHINERGIEYAADLLPATAARLASYDKQLPALWKSFIDQSLFYIISDHKKLSASFGETSTQLNEARGFIGFDSQLTYHYMKMLLHFNRQLVLESLWTVASSLFLPAHNLTDHKSRSRSRKGSDSKYICSNEEASDIIRVCLHGLFAAMPAADNWNDAFFASGVRSAGSILHHRRGHNPTTLLLQAYNDAMSDELALRLARRVFAAIAARLQFAEHVRSKSGKMHQAGEQDDDVVALALKHLNHDRGALATSEKDFTKESRELYYRVSPGLLFDWAMTVITNEWNGSPVIAANSAMGGALAVIAALYSRRVELSIVDGLFISTFFESRLSNLNVPVQWLKFTRNAKEMHVLDHPYLFTVDACMRYFRAINFYNMNHAFETSVASSSTFTYITSPHLLMTDQARRDHLGNRLKTSLDNLLVLNIRRGQVLEDSFDQLWRRERRELARPLKVSIDEGDGVEGIDSGGPQQEFVRMALEEALAPDAGLFTVDGRTRMAWFQPSSPQPLWKFELIGLIVSLAIYNGLTLPVTFPQAMYSKLLGKVPSNINHIVDGWPDLAKNLDALLNWNESELGMIEDVLCRTYEFSIPLFEKNLTREMIRGIAWPQYDETFGHDHAQKLQDDPDVRMVDASNRDEFVADYIHWLTDVSIAPQFEAFKKGFLACLHPKSLTLFTPYTLSTIVEGITSISISALRSCASYEGYSPSDPYIISFWEIVSEYSDEEKRKLLQFVTASERIPTGGYKQVTFRILRNGEGGREGRLPTAYTCYGNLLLPAYENKEILKDKLAMAFQQTHGFGFA